MRARQRRIIERLDQMLPMNYDGTMPPFGGADLSRESADGITAEEAFFLKTDRGIESSKIKDVRRYNQLLAAHRRLSLNVEFWKEALEHGYMWWYEMEDWMLELAGVSSSQIETWRKNWAYD